MSRAKHTKDAMALRRRQLDRRLSEIDVEALTPPTNGWVRTTRQALGLNGRQLAERVGISQSHLSHIEKAEPTAAIEMRTLAKVAEAMECDLVYAIVPRTGALEETLRQRALAVSTKLVGVVAGSMALEAQATDSTSREELIESTAAELIRTLDKDLWDLPL